LISSLKCNSEGYGPLGSLPRMEMMSTTDRTVTPAVFTRNHRPYLEKAANIGRSQPSTLVTFRSEVVWRKASELLALYGSLPIYIAVIDEGSAAQYAAILRKLDLNPRESRSSTRALLKAVLKPTRGERVWSPGEGTLYAISACRSLRPTRISRLRKLADGTPLSSDYRYSYALVESLAGDKVGSLLTAADTGEPPAAVRKRYVSSRIVRDSALVRSLKAKHRNRCQLCGHSVRMDSGATYSEAHHVRPLGDPHNGPDDDRNIMIVCPNHHAMLDWGGIRLSRTQVRSRKGHRVAKQYIDYHNRHIVS
jgi:hypothetical protein